MKPSRRNFLHLAAAGLSLPALSRSAWAQSYPTRPARLVVPFPPGQATDTVGRLIGQSLTERLGQGFVIENRTGAGGTIGTEAVAHAAPDGYTLLLNGLSGAFNATLYRKPDFDFLRDLTPVASIGGGPYVMMINPSVPAKTVPEFIAYAKANPGKLNMGSSGNGSVSHVFGELFKMETGIELVHVPSRGGYITDLIGGQTQVVFGTIAASITLINAGKLRALAVTTAARAAAMPDVPAIGESVPGYDGSQWYGICAPKDTPAAIVDKLNGEINAALGDANLKARLADLGVDPMPATPAGFGKFMAVETEKWAKVIRTAKLQAG
ncbi:Bug family tripartite tricarboxylate transporter substrate binding protein [Rhodoplanes sp. Z2-YC6860]|uniref:Bug family tripartite tricarboxylate transporter substrate binding protein n=1 Tax=Rhodoplanes sp. Z2-YC6860 TaxID=674703 RepID=UPI00078B9E1C|nr:tripartite tricarboxylate transporter substrate binding protein [Rhodoplanes sp. Z2-YC6860]AMN43514.1 TTT family tricarboxylate transporter, receptor protein [Rhodoplanes sp. Z2-YC6860]